MLIDVISPRTHLITPSQGNTTDTGIIDHRKRAHVNFEEEEQQEGPWFKVIMKQDTSYYDKASNKFGNIPSYARHGYERISPLNPDDEDCLNHASSRMSNIIKAHSPDKYTDINQISANSYRNALKDEDIKGFAPRQRVLK